MSACNLRYLTLPALLPYLRGHDGSNAEMKNHARHGTDQEQRSTPDLVDERQDAARGHQEDDILDRGGVEVGVSSLFPSSQHRFSPHIGVLGVCLLSQPY